MSKQGSLVCVGVGMTLGAHISPRSRSHIEQSDVVFAAVSDPLVEMWLQQMHPDVRSLQPFYTEGKSRQVTYLQMVDAILTEVRAGKRVCGAFYGHPGVFAWAPHKSIAEARAEGYSAHMEPGISAEDCLYADLGIDPGEFGCQHYEASQLMLYRRRIDTSAYLMLWQAGIAGDRSSKRYATGPAYRQLLLEVLMQDYTLDQSLTIYEATTLAISAPRIERTTLRELPAARLELQSTLVILPARVLQPNRAVMLYLDKLDANTDAG